MTTKIMSGCAALHLFDLRKKATPQVLLSAHANLEVLPDPQCPKVFLACFCLLEKMDAPVLITTVGPLTAMISTFNHFPDFRPCCILLCLPASKALFLPLEDREERTSFVRQDLGECLLVVILRDVFA